MNEDLILTIDFGTQSVRTSIFDKDGNILAMEKEIYDPAYRSPKPGYAEQDPDSYYECLCKCTKRLAESHSDLFPRIKGITETCFRDSAVLLDKEGKVVRPMILWLDQRYAECKQKLPFISRFLFKLVGMKEVIRMNRKRTMANWIKENEPDNWAKVDKYIPVSTYFIYRLSGQLKDSAANATGHYPIDFKKKKWYPNPEKHLKGQIFSIKESMLCEIVPEGSLIGEISEKAHLETGLPAGLKIYACGSDKSCETLGVGVTDSDAIAISLGTACTVETTVKKYTEPISFLPCYPSCINGYYNMDVQIYRGFWMINWFMKEFGAKNINDIILDDLDASDYDKEMMEIPAGSDGLILQPYWGSQLDRPIVKGAIIGFSDATRKIHVYKAIIEGIAYALKEGAVGFEKKLKKKFKKIRISGGGSKSDQICQIMSDVFNLPVERAQTYETSSLGAAIAGFLAIGTYKDVDEAIKNMVHVSSSFKPNEANAKVYENLFNNTYLKLYPSLKGIYSDLWNISKR